MTRSKKKVHQHDLLLMVMVTVVVVKRSAWRKRSISCRQELCVITRHTGGSGSAPLQCFYSGYAEHVLYEFGGEIRALYHDHGVRPINWGRHRT